jgi:hypothetical protein
MKSKLIYYAFLFIVIFFSNGCSSGEEISKVMASWVGSHYSDMMLKWGPPTYSTIDGKGGQILVYQYDRSGGQIPGYVTKLAGTVYYTAPQSTSYTAEKNVLC